VERDDSILVGVEHLKKSYPAPVEPLQVLRDISFELSAGQALAVMGPSGSGKSTLLNILGGLDKPTSGRVLFEGEDLNEFTPDRMARFRNKEIGFVFQDHHLLPQCTAIENVLLPCLAFGKVSQGLQSRANEILALLGLSDKRLGFPSQLSGGERQRVAIARSMINLPRLLLCDEPTGNLDGENSAKIGELLLSLRDNYDVAMIVVTHNAQFARLFGKQMTLRAGTLYD